MFLPMITGGGSEKEPGDRVARQLGSTMSSSKAEISDLHPGRTQSTLEGYHPSVCNLQVQKLAEHKNFHAYECVALYSKSEGLNLDVQLDRSRVSNSGPAATILQAFTHLVVTHLVASPLRITVVCEIPTLVRPLSYPLARLQPCDQTSRPSGSAGSCAWILPLAGMRLMFGSISSAPPVRGEQFLEPS